MSTNYLEIACRTANIDESQILAAYLFGSQLYGTANEASGTP